ncbi:site-specific integrase [uncultured Parabacteroides sp.]|uniref:tyrosine-type recombinase/integrase n=1 Tax=uncultured Parabacteroides sp. TaxID=512312 RepID=UPI00260FF125|nr:site-specific integrase [uncultured Parabacteroides sp.]
MEKKDLVEGMRLYIRELRADGRFSTAKSYQDALNSFVRFCGSEEVPYIYLNKENLRRYQGFLLDRGCAWNTVSTYMRRLRCVYNIAVEEGLAPYVPYLFKGIFTGIESKRKKALPRDVLRSLMTVPLSDPRLVKTRQALCLMFQFCGMAFVDFAHLRKENIRDGVLRYKRQKTGTSMLIEIQSAAWELLRELSSGTGKDSPYLFPYLRGMKTGREAHKEYISALAHFNRDLKELAKACGVTSPVTSYTIRHSFATTLKNLDIPIEVISELLGHKSIKTTQIYLKSFSLEKMAAVNKICFESVYNNYIPQVG